nr:hypothetical protein GCM10025732_07200 [Glycomyces mayteni]
MLAAMFPGVGGGLGWNYYWPAHPPSGRRVFRPARRRRGAPLAAAGETGPGGRKCEEFHLVGEGHGTHPRSLDGGAAPQVR